MKEEESIFHRRFPDMDDITARLPNPTEFVKAGLEGFKPPSGTGIPGSIYEASQTFRNLFNDGLKPGDIQGLLDNGLSSKALEVMKKFGFSLPIGSGVSSKKTVYSFPDSEKKLNGTPNLKQDFNALGILDLVLEIIKRVSDDDTPTKKEFYTALNFSRKNLFLVLSNLHASISEVLSIHEAAGTIPDASRLMKVYNSEEVFTSSVTVRDQLVTAYRLTREFCAEARSTHVSRISPSSRDEYLSSISSIEKLASSMEQLSGVYVFKYVREDLKALRKTEENQEYVPL